MKKLLLTAIAALGLLPGITATSSAELVAEDRSGWIIKGCSNETGEGAGLGTLDAIKDGNAGTYWHSVWHLSHNAPNHYFVVDRGEALAQTALSAVGYTPRQSVTNGNGFVRECDIYMLDSVEGLNLVASSNSNSICEGGHNIEDFVASLTPTGHGSFTYTHGNASNRGESKVEFSTPTDGRYILFVATETNGDSNNQSYGNVFCHCAEFNAYVETAEEDITQKVKLPGSGLTSVAALEDGKEYLIYDTFSGRHGFHYEKPEDASRVFKTQQGLDATDVLDMTYVWVAEEAEGNWKFVNKATGKYIATLSHWLWGSSGVAEEGGVFAVTYTETDNAFTLKNAEDDVYWSGDTEYLAGDGESGKHNFMFIDAAPLYVGSVPVTLTYPAVGGVNGKVTIDVPVGASIDAQGLVPVPNFFTLSGIAEEDKVVSGTNNQFTVEGTWSLPFELNMAYRIDIRMKSSGLGCSNLLYEAATKKINTRNATNQDAFVPERLFYLDGKGLDATTGNLIVTLHSIAADAATGFEVTSGNDAVGMFSATPTEFRVVTNRNGTSTGISLQHPESTQAHVNDLEAGLGIWNNASSQNDAGSFLRFFALSDGDFDGLLSGEDAALYSQENIDAARATRSAADVRTLFADKNTYIAAIAEANTLLAALSVYTEAHFGTAPGYYSGSDYDTINGLADVLTQALGGYDVDAITAALEALKAEVAKVTLNVPVAGKFYRFQNKASGKFMTGTVNASDYLTIVADGATAFETVFYFDGTRLVALQDGKVLGNFNATGAWKTLYSTDANVGTVSFAESSELGTLYVQPCPERRIYGAGLTQKGDAIDAGDLRGTGANYSWIITEVEWLPIPGSNNEIVAIYTPAALNLKDEVSAYTATVSGAQVIATEIEGTVVPANTPVLLQFTDAVERDGDNGLVYLEIATEDAAAVAEAPASAPLTGSIYAKTAAEGTKYFTAQKQMTWVTETEQVEAVDFWAYEGNLPGFSTYIEVAEGDVPADVTGAGGMYDIVGEDFVTGIEEIEAGANNAQTVIYDLQGRRLSAPVKGINIINGKKVLVK